MGIFKKDGTRVTKANIPTAAVSAADTPKQITVDLYETRKYGRTDPKPEGSILKVKVKAGTVMLQSQIDKMFPAATIDSISPATGGVAGGTVVTITGTNLDGTTAVNFGGTAGTALTVVSDTQLTVTTPAKAASTVNVDVVDDGGTVSKASGFVFA